MPAIFFRGTNYSAVSTGALETILEKSLNMKGVKQFTGFNERNITPEVTKLCDFTIDSDVSKLGKVIVYNNAIHILGYTYFQYGPQTCFNHYVLSPNSSGVFDCTKLDTTLPTELKAETCVALVHNGKIHLFTGTKNLKHYAFDGSAWETLTDLSLDDYTLSSAVSHGGYIYILDSYGRINKWNETDDSLDTGIINIEIYDSNLVSFDGYIYIIGGRYVETSEVTNKVIRLKFLDNGYSDYREQTEQLPFLFKPQSCVVYKDSIHILGAPTSDTPCIHLKYNKNMGFVEITNSNFDFDGNVVSFNDQLYEIGLFHSVYTVPSENKVEVSAYLPKDTVVAFNNLEASELKEVTNATKQEDGISFKVLEDGIVTATVESSKELKYTII